MHGSHQELEMGGQGWLQMRQLKYICTGVQVLLELQNPEERGQPPRERALAGRAGRHRLASEDTERGEVPKGLVDRDRPGSP